MGDEPKKISFGFSKLSKKPAVLAKKEEEKGIQFIKCVEENSIKLVNGEESDKKELVIPLVNANILRDNMVEALKARKEEKKAVTKHREDENNENKSIEERPLTLDELAAKEILEDLNKDKNEEDVKGIQEIPTSNVVSIGEKESTLEDYENIPIQEFGLALLRGMGWAPEKGVGKNGQIVQPVNPVVRPKGMGLGADKVMATTKKKSNNEDLVMKKSAPLKILSGPYKNMYGKVEGFEELPGRIMVRLTLQNTVISISENVVELVTIGEFNKNSKVLNLNDYNKYVQKNDSSHADDTKKDSERDYPNTSKIKNLQQYDYKDRKREKNQSPCPGGHEKYQKSENKESSSEAESVKYYESKRKQQKKKKYSSSSDSEEYKNKKMQMKKRQGPNYEDEYITRKSRKGRERSPSTSSESDYKAKSSAKHRRRKSSDSDEEEKRSKKYKDSRKNSSYSKEEKRRNNRSTKNRSESSDSEEERYSKSKKEKSKSHKHAKKEKYVSSDSDHARNKSKSKKHGKSSNRYRSRSKSPNHKKKKYRSRS